MDAPEWGNHRFYWQTAALAGAIAAACGRKESTRWLMGVVISMGLLQSALVTGLVLKLVH
ncbi:MAG TPA: hypothetical protein VJ752_20915 [Burkholderiaceae bacterium]|nr:hypothetical protein [Burkholderiaceae bacterium]